MEWRPVHSTIETEGIRLKHMVRSNTAAKLSMMKRGNDDTITGPKTICKPFVLPDYTSYLPSMSRIQAVTVCPMRCLKAMPNVL